MHAGALVVYSRPLLRSIERPSRMANATFPSPMVNDRALLQQVAQGIESALGNLYDRYSASLYALAYRITGERADAEEVVLEAFAQMWRDATRFESERGSVIAWLTMITRSRALDLVRAKGRRHRLADSAAAAEPEASPAMGGWDTNPAAAIDQEERRRHVAQALSELSPAQRQAIELAYYEGLSQSEIAERLHEPLGTIKTRVRLGMQKLRDALRPYFAEARV